MVEIIEYPPNCTPIACSSNSSELVRKLKTLSEALQVSDTNDECGQPNRYQSLIRHLSNERFLENHSKDVQIWLACCLADILRVFAPNVPLGDPSQLKNVLIFIVKALKGLESPSNPLFRRYFYLLENLSVVSTLVLCLELPQDDANQIIRLLLKTAMEVANGKEWKAEVRGTPDDNIATDDDGEEKVDSRDKVIALLIGMISKLLRDVDQVSLEVLDVLFFYLINPQKLNNRESYNMARQIVQVSQTSLEAAIQSLLTQSLLSGGLPPECDMVGSGRNKLHEVILELHEVAPELVAPVLPQISTSLRAEDDQQRVLATKLVGKLASSGKARFFDDHPKLWKFYLDRFKDTSTEVREICAKDAHLILLRHSQLRGQVSAALSSLSRDLDDSVRLTAVLCIIETARRKLDAVNESLIMACCDRMKDKKPKIRHEAIAKLLCLYYKVIISDEHTASETASVAIIPKKALALYMLASMTEEKLMIERYFTSYIIPYKMEMPKRIKSMIDLFSKLDKFEAQVFAEIVARSAVHRRILREMLDIISRQAASEDKAQLQSKIQRISSTHHDPTGFSVALKHFANLLSTDQKSFENAEYLVSNDYTTSKVEEACKELVARSENVGTIPKDCQTNIRRYTERVAPLIMDQDSSAEFLRVFLRVQSDADCGNIEASIKFPSVLRLLKIWGESFPHLFSRSDAIHSLVKIISSENAVAVETGLQVLYHVTLQSSLKVKEQKWCDTVASVNITWSNLARTKTICSTYDAILQTHLCRSCCLIDIDGSGNDEVAQRKALSKTASLTQQSCSLTYKQVWEVLVSENDGFGRCCKLAVRVICRLLGREECTSRFNEVYSEIEERVTMDNPGACVNALQVISEFHRDLPHEFGARVKVLIAEFVVPGLILSPMSEGHHGEPDLVIPLEEQAVSKYCLPKVYGMKLLARYLYGSGGEVEDDSLALKTFKMFAAFIQAAGDLHDPDKNISMTEKAWLRAVAGSSLLKLCYIQKYSQMVGIDVFATLATLMIDSADCVRSYFVRRLNKGILRNRLTVEYLALFSLADLVTASSSDEEQAVKMYREQCRGFLISAINRRRSLIQSAGFSPMYLPYHQPEYAVAYSIWLLAQQPMLTTHSDLPSLAALQECLWFVMEAFLAKKENTDFEFIYRLLQDIKESNDAHFEKRRKQGELGQAEVVGQSKKMWALADLGMLMLTYRAKVTIRHEPRKPLLSSRFFVRDKNTEHSRTVYAPHELIEDEKERNGKLPTDEKRRFLNATSNTSKRGAGASKNTTKLRKGRANTGKELDRGDVLSSPEITIVSKRTNRKPLQVEQESVVVEEKVKREGKKPPVTPVNSPSNLREGMPSRSSSRGGRAKNEKTVNKSNGNSIIIEDCEVSPSTSKEPTSTRSLRRPSSQQQPTPTKKLSRKRTSSPLNNDIVSGPASINGVAKESGKSPRKTRVSSLEQFPDGIDFSPITSTGVRVTKGRTRPIPISTSTPMPQIPPKSKAAVRKRTKRDSSSQPTDDLEQQPQQKKPQAPLTSRTRSQRSNPSSPLKSSPTKAAARVSKSPLRSSCPARRRAKAK